MDSEIEPVSDRTRAKVAKDRLDKIDQLVELAKDHKKGEVAEPTVVDDDDESEMNTEKVKKTIQHAQKLSETDGMIRKMSKRISRHRTEIDELVKAYESLKVKIKEDKKIVLDDNLRSEIAKSFVSKEDFEELKKLTMGGLSKQLKNVENFATKADLAELETLIRPSQLPVQESLQTPINDRLDNKIDKFMKSGEDLVDKGESVKVEPDADLEQSHSGSDDDEENLQNDNDSLSLADTDELTEAISEHESRMTANDLTETETKGDVVKTERDESPTPPSELKLAEQGKDYVRSYPLRYNTFADIGNR